MGEYKTPGVYIKEKNAFGNSVVEAETAIPAFIGYTEKARNGNDDLKNVPWKISSMTEFIQYFGGAPKLSFTVDIVKYHQEIEITKEDEKIAVQLDKPIEKPKTPIFQLDINTDEKEVFEIGQEKKKTSFQVNYAFCIDGAHAYTLYYNMQLFFANGGGACYIVSVGNYEEALNKDSMIKALDTLKLEQEITMVVIPEAVKLSDKNNFKDVQQQMLSHCGYDMKNRFALLDIYPKEDENTRIDSQVNVFWENIGSSFLSYGAAYFPWLNTSVLGERDLDGNMFTWGDKGYTYWCKFSNIDPGFSNIINAYYGDEFELKAGEAKTVRKHEFKFDEVNKKKEGDDIYLTEGETEKAIGKIEKIEDIKETKDNEVKVVAKKIKVIWKPSFINIEDKQTFHLALLNSSFVYKQMMKGLLKSLNLLPPSAAMAGIYTMVDRSRGVWKAPANVTLSYVDSVAEDIDDEQQAGLNAPMNGKAINVIRPFRGEGIKVWGARTLDGNSLDWRYINVRRTLLFLEESVKNAARAYVFEPNDAGTWINMKCMIESFLRSVWKRGGLAGATPEDAYEVHIGLGDTMTAEDILEGIMRITVLVAVTHPVEFIEITFQQQMQKS
ncbi:phage tail sheath family protein [Parabacteroides timonensis]|uniref:phage tail sheath family protein n=1 Tax=Parabacteroides timonensis TaxID=1871013 RepID=UPI00094E795D|nr:phage tail sheath C-terminal domain-containing protein [Parabacteroides timonensis]